MGLQRVERPVVGVPCDGEQCTFEMTARDAGVGGAEAVDDGLELRAHAVVVQRGGEHHHVGGQDFTADAVHAVVLDARPFITAAE